MKEEIKKIIKGEVEDGDEILSKYSHDASIFEVRPKFVIFPKDSEDVQNLVKWVNENKEKHPELSITARCAGTCMSGGAIGESIILDFTKYMNKLISFDENFITVQPGMFYRDFEKLTLEKGLIFPCYTASKGLNAMGGMFGNNSAGEKTLKYGKTEDCVLGSKIVFADGVERNITKTLLSDIPQQDEYTKKIFELIKDNEEIIQKAKPKVSKNSAGYYLWNVVRPANKIPNLPSILPPVFDLNKLFVGSQGTLGIATEITFKLVPVQKYSKLVAVFMKDLSILGDLVAEIVKLNPETLETYDDKTMKLAVKFFPDFLKNKGVFGMIKFMWSFLPELGMMITGGFPKLILLVEFAGVDDADVERQCIELKNKISNFNIKTHITKSESEANKYWDIRRESFNLLRKHVSGKRTAPFIDDIIVRPEFLPKFIPELNKILDTYDITYTIAGHAGDGNFHIIPLMDFSKKDISKIILELGEKVYTLVLSYGGSITAEHNDGIIRTPYVEQMYGEKMYSIFKQVKNIFDPKNILNPGKKVGGTKEYLVSHIALEHPKPEHSI
jgi:FAD/FMN-containing dehydrogenase